MPSTRTDDTACHSPINVEVSQKPRSRRLQQCQTQRSIHTLVSNPQFPTSRIPGLMDSSNLPPVLWSQLHDQKKRAAESVREGSIPYVSDAHQFQVQLDHHLCQTYPRGNIPTVLTRFPRSQSRVTSLVEVVKVASESEAAGALLLGLEVTAIEVERAVSNSRYDNVD
jgi:hypothetical protein